MEPDAIHIYYQADHLRIVATNLENEIADWGVLDTSAPGLQEERNRRGHMLWSHAQQAGVSLFKLCGAGAFNKMPGIKNHICEVRNELMKAIEAFEVRPYYFDSHVGYAPPTNDYNYDVFFVNICDGFCRLWATSFEDQSLFARGSDFALRAKLYVRILKDASDSLMHEFASGKGPHITQADLEKLLSDLKKPEQ